jgi:hypothetical protein
VDGSNAGTSFKKRRARILIDRDFQIRFMARLGGVLVFYLLLFLLISVVAPVAFTFLGDPPEWALTETAFRVEVLLRLILAPLVCTFLCLFAHGVLETFKIAGPNYRYKAVLRDLSALKIPRGVRTRKGDYLRETTDTFDAALTTLHDCVRDLQRSSRDAVAKMKDALADVPASDASRAALAAVTRIDTDLARFSLLSRAPECKPVTVDDPPVEPLETASPAEQHVEPAAAPAETKS